MIDRLLHHWDNEDNELVLRWRIFKMRWIPYSTRELLGWEDETLRLQLGPRRWHRPDRFRKAHNTGKSPQDG